jgi:hypothetical protein
MERQSQISNLKSQIASRACLLLGTLCLLSAVSQAATTFDDYAGRVAQAARQTAELAQGEGRDEAAQKAALKTITELLPATEKISRGGELVHVDNSWLHQAISNLKWGDGEMRAAQLGDIAARLGALERRLNEAELRADAQGSAPSADARARLEQILAREEYQLEANQDSVIRAWVRKIQEAIDRFLLWLFTRSGPTTAPSAGTVRLLRYTILAVTAAALLVGLTMLLRRFRLSALRRKKPEPEETREVLGERIDAALTPDDLLREAAEMARKGEFRLAIRRAYIALLYELEQRGQLKLHRAKTNNDYLRELEPNAKTHRPVAQMTSRYERVWYGRNEATLEDYAGFIDRYREAASVR